MRNPIKKIKDKIKNIKISDIQNTIKKGNRIIKTIHGLREIPPLKENIERITGNKYFKNLEKGLDTADKISGIYNRTKDLKINNVIPNNKFNYENLNRIGEENALNMRKKYLEEQRLNKGINSKKNNEYKIANSIVAEIK